jgi:hypothetical protein
MTENAIVTLAIPTITATGSDRGVALHPGVTIVLVMAAAETGGLQQEQVREEARYVWMQTLKAERKR